MFIIVGKIIHCQDKILIKLLNYVMILCRLHDILCRLGWKGTLVMKYNKLKHLWPVWKYYPAFPWRNWENPSSISVTTASAMGHCQTGFLPSKSRHTDTWCNSHCLHREFPLWIIWFLDMITYTPVFKSFPS